jgi:hypothetical protein
MNKAHLALLELKIKGLNAELAKLGDTKPTEELLKIIHHPGWTTIAEVLLVEGTIASLHAQVGAALQLRTALLEAASRVELNPQPLPP